MSYKAEYTATVADGAIRVDYEFEDAELPEGLTPELFQQVDDYRDEVAANAFAAAQATATDYIEESDEDISELPMAPVHIGGGYSVSGVFGAAASNSFLEVKQTHSESLRALLSTDDED